MLFSSDAFRSFAVAFAVIAAVVAVSCDKVPLTSPTGSTITLSVDKAIVPVGGQAQITAVVIESAGTAVQNGTLVTFSTTMGSVSPIAVETINGRAVTTYIAPSISGSAKINAYSGAASTGSGNSSSGGVSVLVGSAAVGSVSMNVVPSNVPQNGGTVSVNALVLDSSGNPLPSVAVLFTTDQGTLASGSVFTDSNGNAATTLNTNRVTKVTATVGDKKAEFTVNVVTAPTITIQATTTTPLAGQPVSFLLTPTTVATANPIASVLVDYGDGQTQTLGGITGPTGLNHVYANTGGYTVTATARDINNQVGVSSVAIVVTRAALPTISMTVNPNPVLPANDGLTTITVTAGASGTNSIQSVVVKLANGTVIYQGTGGGTFAYRFDRPPAGSPVGTSVTYTITGTATDTAGGVGQTSTTVVVQ